MNDDYVCPPPIRTYKARLLLQPECIPYGNIDPITHWMEMPKLPMSKLEGR